MDISFGGAGRHSNFYGSTGGKYYHDPASSKKPSSSGRYHGGTSGKFYNDSKKPFYKGTETAASSEKKKYESYYAGKKGTSSSSSSSSSHRKYHSSGSSHSSKRVPTYISKNGAVFDQYYNHIPTEKVPVYSKGPGWSSDRLISYSDRNSYGDYSDNVYNSAYDEITIGGKVPEYKTDLNPYKDMIEEMNRLRRENLELGKKAITDETDEFFRKAYINHVKNMNLLPERLFRTGSTGGLTESAVSYMDSAYKNAVRDIEKEKIKNLGQLESKYMETSSKDNAMTYDRIMKEVERMESEKRAYAKLLEERLYKERQKEKDLRLKYYEKYYGL